MSDVVLLYHHSYYLDKNLYHTITTSQLALSQLYLHLLTTLPTPCSKNKVMSEFTEQNLNRFDKILNSDQVNSFDECGYVVLDDFLGAEWADSLLNECKQFQSDELLKQHYFNFGDVKFPKPHVFEADLYDKTLRDMSPPLAYLYDVATPKIISALDALLPDLQLDTGPNSASIKLQFNKGGCFPYHHDNPGRPSKRQLTVIVYLNPLWQPEDGGELVLWPFLGPKVTIAPKMDRVAIFRSDLVLHRVLKSNKERFCFTIWIDGTATNSDEDSLLTKDKLQFESYDTAAHFFKFSPLQRVISRAVFADEYEASLQECVGGTIGEKPMIQYHRANVAALESKLRPLITAFREKKNSINADTNVSYL